MNNSHEGEERASVPGHAAWTGDMLDRQISIVTDQAQKLHLPKKPEQIQPKKVTVKSGTQI